jgi:pSer/pThr/pTyr-binding forkhead associated (FHA) protein
VGRSRSADIQLAHPLVSRKHCELYESEGQLAVRDLGSLNGTFVGEERISEPVFLSPGATVTIGSVTFKALYGDMEDQAVEANADEMPDFMASDDEPRASAVEQTIEMSGDSPVTEPVATASDQEGGFDFGWLEDPAEEDAENQAVEPDTASEGADPEPELEPVLKAKEPEAALELPEPELELTLPDSDLQDGVVDDASEFAPPEEQPIASGDDNDDLDDFFASLK